VGVFEDEACVFCFDPETCNKVRLSYYFFFGGGEEPLKRVHANKSLREMMIFCEWIIVCL
jgi:hypothetical protein